MNTFVPFSGKNSVRFHVDFPRFSDFGTVHAKINVRWFLGNFKAHSEALVTVPRRLGVPSFGWILDVGKASLDELQSFAGFSRDLPT